MNMISKFSKILLIIINLITHLLRKTLDYSFMISVLAIIYSITKSKVMASNTNNSNIEIK